MRFTPTQFHARIAHLISHAGLIQLVSSVVQGFISYWGQLLCFPSVVLAKLEQLCRAFVRSGPSLNPKRIGYGLIVVMYVICGGFLFGKYKSRLGHIYCKEVMNTFRRMLQNFNRPLYLLGKLVEGVSRANFPIQRQNIAVGTVEVLLVLQFREKKTWK
ncbi:hypothetical protein Ancab_039328 [Ancistrocladus abbreviatus]